MKQTKNPKFSKEKILKLFSQLLRIPQTPWLLNIPLLTLSLFLQLFYQHFNQLQFFFQHFLNPTNSFISFMSAITISGTFYLLYFDYVLLFIANLLLFILYLLFKLQTTTHGDYFIIIVLILFLSYYYCFSIWNPWVFYHSISNQFIIYLFIHFKFMGFLPFYF